MEETDEVVGDDRGENCQISIQAIFGGVAHNTIKVAGMVGKQKLTILIDSGATHNFIDPNTVKRLGFQEECSTPLTVTVADGYRLLSGTICSNLGWNMQGHKLNGNLRVLPLGGYDIVLGVEWLKKHSPITFDYMKREVIITNGKKKLVLKEERGK